MVEEEITKEFIEQNLFSKSGYINPQRVKKLGYTVKEIYLLYHNMEEPKCPTCGGPVKFIGFSKGFNKHCSNKCSQKDPDVAEKRRQSCISRYGVDYASQVLENREKVRKTIKNTWLREKDLIIEKRHQTNIEKYGVPEVFQSLEIKDKIKNTLLTKYNETSPMRIPEIKEKWKKTLFDNYGVYNPFKSQEIRDKYRQTNTEKYGVPEVLQSEEVREKIKETLLTKYNETSPMRIPEIKEKWKKTLFDNWDTKSEKIKEKIKKTNLDRYGTEYASQSPEIRQKISKGISIALREKYQDITFKKAGYVYIIYSPKLNLKKVGYTTNLNKRLKELKKAIEDPNLKILQYKYYENATQIEFRIHKILKRFNVVLNEKSIGYTEWYYPVHIQLT